MLVAFVCDSIAFPWNVITF